MTRVEVLLRFVSYEIGEDLEKRVSALFQSREATWPVWLRRVRRPGKWTLEDMRGIDLAFHTLRGPILFQIKGSKEGAYHFKRKHAHDRLKIIVIVVDQRDTDQQIYEQFLHAAQQRYNEL